MMTIKLLKKYRLLLIIILFFAFITRVYKLDYPNTYYFDEVYHAVTANLMAQNDPKAFEWWHQLADKSTAIDWLHPPLAKYTQAYFIHFLGNNSFAWRISSALFGTGVIYLTFLVTNLLFNNHQLSLLASLLASLDGLLLTQSRITMNDIHVTFFILLTVWCYLRFIKQHKNQWLWFTGLIAGLAIASKWSGLLILLTVWLIEFYTFSISLINKKQKLFKIIWIIGERLLSLVILPSLIYLASYAQMFLQGKTINHFIELHKQIWSYQTSLQATHPYQSSPWQWAFNLKPVWFYVNYQSTEKIANIYSFGNPALFWFGLTATFATLFFIFWQILKIKKPFKKSIQLKKLILLLSFYFSTWLPWIFSPRIMFFYHYTPSIPFLSIILAYWLVKLWSMKIHQKIKFNKILTSGIIISTVVCFIIWYPHWTAIAMPIKFINNVYFFIPSWK